MIDICINLTNKRFNKDRQIVINAAKQAGVKGLIITSTNLQESEKAIALTHSDPNYLHCTVGIHPHDAKTFDDKSLQKLRQMAQDPQVKAIGECGLDFNRNFSTAHDQEYAFIGQLELAVELQLPVFMHERDASKRLISLLKPYLTQLSNVVLHCFTGSKSELNHYIELGLHIGITGWICDERRGKALLEIVKWIPDDRLMIETDAPYLLPRNMHEKPKSSRNEPKYLPYIAQTIANARGQSVNELIINSTRNSALFFDL
ncbi:MAG: TatD family hydrolase [Psychromonas sp.]|nr:TatD family hydrolase [Psychromonas sp.]